MAAIMCEQQANICVKKMTNAQRQMKAYEFDL